MIVQTVGLNIDDCPTPTQILHQNNLCTLMVIVVMSGASDPSGILRSAGKFRLQNEINHVLTVGPIGQSGQGG